MSSLTKTSSMEVSSFLSRRWAFAIRSSIHLLVSLDSYILDGQIRLFDDILVDFNPESLHVFNQLAKEFHGVLDIQDLQNAILFIRFF